MFKANVELVMNRPTLYHSEIITSLIKEKGGYAPDKVNIKYMRKYSSLPAHACYTFGSTEGTEGNVPNQ